MDVIQVQTRISAKHVEISQLCVDFCSIQITKVYPFLSSLWKSWLEDTTIMFRLLYQTANEAMIIPNWLHRYRRGESLCTMVIPISFNQYRRDRSWGENVYKTYKNARFMCRLSFQVTKKAMFIYKRVSSWLTRTELRREFLQILWIYNNHV